MIANCSQGARCYRITSGPAARLEPVKIAQERRRGSPKRQKSFRQEGRGRGVTFTDGVVDVVVGASDFCFVADEEIKISGIGRLLSSGRNVVRRRDECGNQIVGLKVARITHLREAARE